MQQYADIYLLQNHSTYFGCPPHPSSVVHKTVTAASGTGHDTGTATSLQRGLIRTVPIRPRFEAGCCTSIMTCTRGYDYSFMYY